MSECKHEMYDLQVRPVPVCAGCNVTMSSIYHQENIELSAKIEQLESQVADMREILQDVLSDCHLTAGMRSEIIKRAELSEVQG